MLHLKEVKKQRELCLHFLAPLRCLHRTFPCPLDPPRRRNLFWTGTFHHHNNVWRRELRLRFKRMETHLRIRRTTPSIFYWKTSPRVFVTYRVFWKCWRWHCGLRHVRWGDSRALTPCQKAHLSTPEQGWNQCRPPGMGSISVIFEKRSAPVLATFLGWQVIPSRGSPLFPGRHGSRTTS